MAWTEYPIRYGHAPDLPSANPDAWQLLGLLPFVNGFGTSYMFDPVSGSPVMDSTHCGGAVLQKVNGTSRYWYGTLAKLWEWNGSTGAPTITDRSGAVYAATTTQPWSFAQFGDVTLAINLANQLQQVNAGATFAAAHATAPRGRIVLAGGPMSLPFVMVLGYHDGVTDSPDGWWCSPTPTSAWTPSIAAQIARANLLTPTGAISAGIAFRDGFVAFKRNAMFMGRYVGPDAVFAWDCIDRSIGCVGKNAVCEADGALYFAGPRGFYVFDGSYAKPLPGYVHEKWADAYETFIAPNGLSEYVRAVFDPQFKIVSFFTTNSLTVGSENLTGEVSTGQTAFHYNTVTAKWSMGNYAAGIGANNAIALIAARFGVNGGRTPTFMNTATTTPYARVISPLIGNAARATTLRGMWPNWQAGTRFGIAFGPTYPSTDWWGASLSGGYATIEGRKRPNSAAPDSLVDPTFNSNYARLDGVVAAQWVRAATTIRGQSAPLQFASVYLDVQNAGER